MKISTGSNNIDYKILTKYDKHISQQVVHLLSSIMLGKLINNFIIKELTVYK